MRPIKFRAWHKEKKEMYPVTSMEWDRLGNIVRWFNKTYELMQFTGIKDRNGKEIYELDIMTAENKLCFIFWAKEYGKFVNIELSFIKRGKPKMNTIPTPKDLTEGEVRGTLMEDMSNWEQLIKLTNNEITKMYLRDKKLLNEN